MARSSILALATALGLASAGGALAQEAQPPQDTDTVGPAALRNFSISGERTTPPAPEQPAATPPPVVELPKVSVAPKAPSTQTPREAAPAAPAETREAERNATVSDEAASDRSVDAPSSENAAPAEANRTSGPSEIPVTVSPDLREPAVRAAPAGNDDFPWFYVLAGGILGLAVIAFLLRRRRGEPVEEELELSDFLSADEPILARAPAAAAPPAAAVPEQPAMAAAEGPRARPRIELDFRPGKASATDTQATVEYELKVANVGDADARKVRIEARLFNAQQDKEIGAFFSSPDAALATLAPRAIPPQSGAVFKSVATLPKDQVHEVVVQGRRLFIPMIAFNVTYEWGDGETGQTSMSYLVGRESQPPAEKMAPFRLDLGPRIYRSVGSRPSRLALTV